MIIIMAAEASDIFYGGHSGWKLLQAEDSFERENPISEKSWKEFSKTRRRKSPQTK